MTAEEFLAFYPQFASVPETVLSAYVSSANARFTDFGEDLPEARRLYTAHRLTLYARTVPVFAESGGGSSSFSALASAGDSSVVTGKKVDDVSITCSARSSSASSSDLSDLNETMYGIQLLTLLRLHSYPRYVP